MAEIRWTQEAATWLEDIYRYIAQDNPEAAPVRRQRHLREGPGPQAFPLIGHRYRSEPEGEIRILLFGHYRIAYLVRNPLMIEVLGVFHTVLDIDRYL